MLTPTQVTTYADQFLEARAKSTTLRPFPANAKISFADAYQIAREIQAKRIAAGEEQVGRKIGFANHALWNKYGRNAPIHELIWTPLFSSTIRFMDQTHGVQSLAGALQPRLTPELIFKIGQTPSPDATVEEIADCLEWMAHGFEIVVCPFPKWEFNIADAIAAFALHGAFLIGEPHQLASTSRHNLGSILANTSVSLSCDSTLLSAGFGSDFIESPLHAIWHLQQLLKDQPDTPTLQAGEIISTGTWTDLTPVKSGQTWSSAFSGASLAGLSVSFID